jgi:hypothetical protein
MESPVSALRQKQTSCGSLLLDTWLMSVFSRTPALRGRSFRAPLDDTKCLSLDPNQLTTICSKLYRIHDFEGHQTLVSRNQRFFLTPDADFAAFNEQRASES